MGDLNLTKSRFYSTSGGEEAPKAVHYPDSPYTTELVAHLHTDPIPTFRMMDDDGNLIPGAPAVEIENDEVIRTYKMMITLNTMDAILNDVQRQGRISFYMQNIGEEAAQFGSALAWHPEDIVYSQYREVGVFMNRGFSLDEFCHQNYSTSEDYGKGRQMPVHYGKKDIFIHTISSPLGTQIPQTPGAAFALKMQGKPNVAVGYFGDGSASEGDFHAAMNFSSTLRCPAVFVCRNNKFAISTPSTDQYYGDGIAARGYGYGMHYMRLEGNDLFAVYHGCKLAREIALKDGGQPVLVELMTYRMGHHSTSDDSTRYRDQSELKAWAAKGPVQRVYNYLVNQGLWNEEQDKGLKKECRVAVLKSLKSAEATKWPAVKELFTDVYDKITPNLLEQKDHLYRFLDKHGSEYGLDKHAPD